MSTTPNAAPDMAPVELRTEFEDAVRALLNKHGNPWRIFDFDWDDDEPAGYSYRTTALAFDLYRQCIEASRAAVRAPMPEITALIDVVMRQCSGYSHGPGFEAAEAARRLKAALSAAPPQSAPADAPKDNMRPAFEAWASDGGKWSRAVERSPHGHYLLAQTESSWHAWRAGVKAATPGVTEVVAWMEAEDFQGKCIPGSERLTMTDAWKRHLLAEGGHEDYLEKFTTPLYATPTGANVALLTDAEPQ